MNIFERKYCIVDTEGRYYTVNEYDALEAVKDPDLAKWFDILEANKRINSSGMPKQLRTVEAAKAQRKGLYAINREAAGKTMEEAADNTQDGLSMEDIDMGQLVKELNFLRLNLQPYIEELRQGLGKADEEICDLLHYIELYQYDELQSIELVRQIRDCRIRRREIKDELYRAESFTKLLNAGGVSSLLKEISKQIGNMSKREYKPRRLHSLFRDSSLRMQDPATSKNDPILHKENIPAEEETIIDYGIQESFFDDEETEWEDYASKERKAI